MHQKPHTPKVLFAGFILTLLLHPLPCGATAPDLGALYDRLAADLTAGKPLAIEVHVALCDNDSQGIVPVKNRSICNGDNPGQNMYWASSGGLRGVLNKSGWKKVSEETGEGDILQTIVWTKRMTAAGELTARGVSGSFEARLTGVAWRGSRIHRSMKTWLRVIHEDQGELTPHLVGYIGHNYFMDINDSEREDLLSVVGTQNTPAMGVFALSCTGDTFIRPAIKNNDAYVVALNRYFTFPHAATVDGIASGIAEGLSPGKLHRKYARRFSDAQQTGMAWALKTFAFGPGTRPVVLREPLSLTMASFTPELFTGIGDDP